MTIPIYQVDAFTDRLFAGNPAAVCPLEAWLDDPTLQAIAAENNLAETAFFVRAGDREEGSTVPRHGRPLGAEIDRDGLLYDLRWFTPTIEMDLCGHATLASAYVVFRFLVPSATDVTFKSRSGPLRVTRDGDLLSMRLPRRAPSPCEPPAGLLEGLGRRPAEVLRSRDYLAVYEREADILALRPDMRLLEKLDAIGVIVTAPGERADFVSRFFAPAAGVPEDPVTGSAHCTLIPYWSQRLGRKTLRALQVSSRGGELFCQDEEDAVTIAGRAVLYMEGVIRT